MGPMILRFSRFPSPSFRTYMTLYCSVISEIIPRIGVLSDSISIILKNALEVDLLFYLSLDRRDRGTSQSILSDLVPHQYLDCELALLLHLCLSQISLLAL